MTDLRAAVYLRPSTTPGPSDDHALSDLKRLATERNWTVVTTFHDRANLLQAATHHQFDVLVVSSLGQLGDSLRQVVQTVHQLRSHGVHLYVCDQDLDTTGDIGAAVSTVFTALVQCERDQLRERSRSGLDRARRNGVRIGRPSNFNDSVRAAVQALHGRGVPIRQIARQLRIGNATVYKALQAVTGPTPTQASPDLRNAFRTPLGRSEPVRNGVPA